MAFLKEADAILGTSVADAYAKVAAKRLADEAIVADGAGGVQPVPIEQGETIIVDEEGAVESPPLPPKAVESPPPPPAVGRGHGAKRGRGAGKGAAAYPPLKIARRN